jgi:hypothetical protein
MDEHKRNSKGKEFQSVGAVYEKERRPMDELILGTARRPAEDERR